MSIIKTSTGTLNVNGKDITVDIEHHDCGCYFTTAYLGHGKYIYGSGDSKAKAVRDLKSRIKKY